MCIRDRAYIILHSLNMSIVIGICVLINMVVGAMIGSFTPLMLKHLSGDIAIISSPLISVLLDMIGVVSVSYTHLKGNI